MPNWAKGVITLAVCYVVAWVASAFLKGGESDLWD